MIDIHEKLKQLRKNAGVKQIEVAKAINIARNTLSQFETGLIRPSYEVLVEIAKYYDVPIDYLLGLSDEYGNPL